MADEEKNEETTEETNGETQPTESAEDAAARVEHVRGTQFFGDLTVVPESQHAQEAGEPAGLVHNVNEPVPEAAPEDEADTSDEGEEDAESDEDDEKDEVAVTPADEPVSEVDGGNTVVDHTGEENVEEADEASAEEEADDLTAADKITRIKQATSVEEVDALSEDDDRTTVVRAANRKREELES